ncbi:5'-nucleotidase C-terminal domain-containing protein [Aquibium sp. ELW1220]|uniref:5'-nucleotidase C-terminal domain-containing protein n=1 Tax=Aquibium sp. ELW1220 TaxID=2976766 RepID=UPI0025AF4252|nr:5'-nucleotidase C-terminal domain-containing protein [Aquibium sp. ELW1220]MDN2579262.1 5'-nucleotidase C-terminal domain-containing protein [Aquibium sp. ELW1220]
MNRPSFVVSRRLVLQGIAASAVAAALPAVARAQTGGDAVLFTIADLHAPYARLPALLARLRALRTEAGRPAALLINGDVFERGNAVCLKSNGAADWAFLEAVAAEMPVVLNLGNHETAVLDDMASFVARADRAGVQVISNLVDNRTGRFFAPFDARLGLGGMDVSVLGLAATNPFVYRKPVRDTLTFLDTARFVADALPGSSAGADASVVMSHAGVSPDKTFLSTLPAGTIVQGAHDHLDLDMTLDGRTYFHGASWGRKIGIVELAKGGAASYRAEEVAPSGGDEALAALIEAMKAEHLTEADCAVIAELPRAFDLHESILLATEALRQATDADVAMLGHTTFGAPLAAGPLSRYDFDAYVRFGGGVSVASISGEKLSAMLARANQFMAETLDGMTGDYVHVAEIDVDPAKTYRLAVNDWTAQNQQAYLGTTDLAFEKVEGLELKALIAEHLAATF